MKIIKNVDPKMPSTRLEFHELKEGQLFSFVSDTTDPLYMKLSGLSALNLKINRITYFSSLRHSIVEVYDKAELCLNPTQSVVEEKAESCSTDFAQESSDWWNRTPEEYFERLVGAYMEAREKCLRGTLKYRRIQRILERHQYALAAIRKYNREEYKYYEASRR